MSDINDDLLNYELGDLEDTVLAADEDELLQSDDESSPTKLSQQEEALLLDDEEQLLNCPPHNESNISLSHEELTTPDTIHFDEFRDDLVTTTTPEPTTSKINTNEATTLEDNHTNVGSSSRPALKRTSEAQRSNSDDSTSAVLESKKLRVDAPEFVPAAQISDSESFVREDENGEDNGAPIVESVSFVSTSSNVDGRPEEEIATTDSCAGLCLTADDEFEQESNEEPHPIPAQSTGEDGGIEEEAGEAASSSGMEESEFDFAASRSNRKPALLALPEFETEDEDEGNERLNPKHHVERDSADDAFNKTVQSSNAAHFHNRNQRGGNRSGPTFPGPNDRRPNNYRFASQSQFNQFQGTADKFNPHFANQYRPTANERGPSLLMNPHTPPLAGVIAPLLQFRGLLPTQPQSIYRPMYNDGGRPPRMSGPPALMSRQQRPPQMQQRPSFGGPQHQNHQPSFRSTSPFNHQMRPHQQHNMPPRFEHHQASRMMPGPSPQHQSQHGPPQFMQPRIMQPMAYGVGSGIGHGGQIPPMGHVAGPRGGAPPLPAAQPVIPRKVLINPNFKGGVEAATNQLMLETMKNPQFMPNIAPAVDNKYDAELLRQQEAFINQNRMHIEKRRHERSPDRDHRERSYSPPSHGGRRTDRRVYNRERDEDSGGRKPAGTAGGGGGSHRGGSDQRVSAGGVSGGAIGGRDRRAGSRETYETVPKRRRSSSLDRDGRPVFHKDSKEPEDEETRAYRLEIEKQKFQREKILKDKEIRRRKLVENQKVNDDVKPEDQSAHGAVVQTPQQLTPIVVTEKKIISLKKKDSAVVNEANVASTTTKLVRSIPTAKVYPESIRNSGTTAVVKPVIKPNVRTVIASSAAHISHHHNQKNASEFDDEDELLADSPSSSPTYGHAEVSTVNASLSQKTSLTAQTSDQQPSKFANRRVVLKSSKSTASSAFGSKQTVNKLDRKQPLASGRTTTAATSKGVFDRLERKVVNTSDPAKRKIQRIVIQNSD